MDGGYDYTTVLVYLLSQNKTPQIGSNSNLCVESTPPQWRARSPWNRPRGAALKKTVAMSTSHRAPAFRFQLLFRFKRPAVAHPGRKQIMLKHVGPCSLCGKPRPTSSFLASAWLHYGCCNNLRVERADGN